jgi:hypothetical protein
MPIGILSRRYCTQTRGLTTELSDLKACIGERIKVITNLYFDQILIPVFNESSMYFNPPSEISGKYYNDDLIWFEDANFLNNCQVGDIFLVDLDAGGPNPPIEITLLEKVDSQVGRFDTTFVSQEFYKDGSDIYFANITPLKALIYQYGLNESGDYISLTDGSLQKFSISDGDGLCLNLVLTQMGAYGNKDWQATTLAIQGFGDSPAGYPAGAQQIIKLEHIVLVTPLFLVGELELMQAGLPPERFLYDNSIKYKAQIDWNKNNAILDPSKSLTLDPVGQFGWFNKRFDGQNSDYSMTSLTIKRVSDGEFVNQLEYGEMEVKFTLNSTAGSFHAGNSRLIFGFNYLPQDQTLYQNQNRFLEANFAFDSKLFSPNNITVNGDKFATNDQVIKTVKGQVISANTCEVTVRILFGSNQDDILRQEDVANYAMWCIMENISFDTELCDKTNLLVQVNTIHEQLTTVDLIDDQTEFIEHPYNTVGAGLEELEMFPVDDVAASSLLSINYAGLEDDGILLKSCNCQLVLKHATEADIVLDSFRINLENFPIIGSLPGVQAIDFEQQRPYKIEDGIRKTVTFDRDFTFDTASTKYWRLNFPFMNRWEYWIKIANLSSLPVSLFDSTVPFNGANHFWNRLINTAGWSLMYRKTFLIEQNGEIFEQETEQELTSTDFNSNPEWTSCTIKTYDVDTNDEIIVGPKKYAYSSGDTKVVASFTKSIGIVPNIGNIAIVIWGEGFEGGGISEITRISSKYDVIGSSMFKSIDGSDKVKVTKTGNVFTGEALIKGDKIANLSKITLYARIYHPVDNIEDDARVTNDFSDRLTNDGLIRTI